METPEVQVAGIDVSPAPTNMQHTETPEPDTNAIQNADAVDEDPSLQDITLPDVAPESDPKPAEDPAPTRRKPGFHFLEFLTSPIVEIVVGQGDCKTTLTAHQDLLMESPFLAALVEKFKDSGERRIEVPDENVEAFGYFLQYQYTRDYSTNMCSSEQDVGEIDDSGEHLLKHARVYTLAEKLGIPSLKNLAHSKIHRINSSSQGELTYARYVYTHTPPDDETIRKPVAKFWARSSHFLRHEAEEEFRKLCVEVPDFCFDVLSLVLDSKEKRTHDRTEAESGIRGSGRKRLRSGF
ncbi:hypothetical protein BDV59DRAFT_122119 [Aspergillus ambiguus]|uniref:uncharacterized protein n=1 Tax=Aspergillus ambiguus TaxID=176160 RepID=UPI003CCCBB37